MDCSHDDKYPVWIPELFGRFQLTTNLGDLESILPNLKKNIRQNNISSSSTIIAGKNKTK